MRYFYLVQNYLKYIYLFGILTIGWSCEQNDVNSDRNPCLIDKSVNYIINLNLPLYSDLKIPGNGIFITDTTNFIRGVYVFYDGLSYVVLELSEPNDCQSTCKVAPRLVNGQFTYTCNGDIDKLYNILGFPIDSQQNPYSMRRYQTSLNGNLLYISY